MCLFADVMNSPNHLKYASACVPFKVHVISMVGSAAIGFDLPSSALSWVACLEWLWRRKRRLLMRMAILSCASGHVAAHALWLLRVHRELQCQK